MTPERLRQIGEICRVARDRSPEQRSAYLDGACGEDRGLRRQVEALLAEEPSQPDATVTMLEGRRLGPYHVLTRLGAGGMGEVYRAHDSKLGRDVAVKTLPPAFAEDPERLARFRREARTLASLNHPNIGAIYELEEFDGTTCLVLELVEGKTLRGPLPVELALEYGSQIAEALEAAHAKGITHRDLKPANIKVTPEGRVKVLDFGLAKAVWGIGDQDLSSLSVVGSQSIAGQIVGTPPYMSPEQARGGEVNQRTDVWAFGCVLYELLAGKRAFGGSNLQETLREIFELEPDWSALPPKTPVKIRGLLRRCLEKDAARRLPDIRLAREEIGKARRGSRRWIAAAVAGVAIILAAAAVSLWPDRRPFGPDQWVQLTRLSDSVGQPALSPDGRMVAFVRGASTFYTPGEIYVKMLPDGEAVQLTNDGLKKMSPVFSPDGSRIAYTVTEGGKWDTWQVPVINGRPRAWLENASGLSWIGKDRVMFSEIKDNDIHMAIVAAQENRAEARDVYVPAGIRGMAHRSYLSPDGKWSLIVEMDRGPWLPCRLVSTDGQSPGRQVGPPNAACTFAAWSPDGKWMFLSSGAGGAFHIWRQRFPDGEPEQITSGPTEEDGIAMAADGRSFVTAVASRQSAVWIHGPEGERQVSLEGFAFDPKFTPDGKRLLYRILKGATLNDASELRVTDLESGLTEPLLPGVDIEGPQPTYDVTRDGRQAVVAGVDREGKRRLWLVPLGRGSPPCAIPGVEGVYQPQFGASGEIIFGIRAMEGLLMIPHVVREDGTGLRKLGKEFIGIKGLAPDNKWLVAVSTETKDLQRGTEGRGIIARSLTGEEDLTLMSPSAGTSLTEIVCKWSPDGRTLVFVPLALYRGQDMKAYSFPLPPGKMFPTIPPGGFRSEAEMAKVPGAKAFDVYDYAPGPTQDVYAFTRESVQRNLYRVPLR